MLVGIQIDTIDAIWPDIEAMLADACRTSNGRYLPADVRARLADGRWQLWTVWRDGLKAIIVTEIIVYPQTKACRIRIVTGRGRETWQADAIGSLERWAKSLDCTLMEGEARIGWTRVSKRFGYAHTHSILEKVI